MERLNQVGEHRIFIIEGNIGAGKSTLGINLASTGLVGYIPEPVKRWQTKYKENILELFYKDSKRNAFLFQLAAFATRAKTFEEVIALVDHSNVFLERSIFSDRYVFAKTLYELGDMTETEFQVYCDIWEWVNVRWAVKPEKILYVKTPSEVCLERIKERARGEEVGVNLDYLKILEQKHDEWLLDHQSVLIIDGTEPIDHANLLKKLGVS